MNIETENHIDASESDFEDEVVQESWQDRPEYGDDGFPSE